MNLYKHHENPKSLDFYAEAQEKVPDVFWDKYKNNPEELKKREKDIAKSTKYAYRYAHDILKGRWTEGEAAISKDTEYISNYVYLVIMRI